MRSKYGSNASVTIMMILFAVKIGLSETNSANTRCESFTACT